MRNKLPRLVRLCLLALVPLSLPSLARGEIPEAVIKKLAQQRRNEIALLNERIANIEASLRDYKFTDYSKDIAKLAARVEKLQAGIEARKKQGRSVTSNQKDLDAAKHQLDSLKSKDSSQQYTHKKMSDDLARCRSSRADGTLSSTGPLFMPQGSEMRPPSAGDVGALYGQFTKVLQIIDDKSMLITVSMGPASAVAMLKMPTDGLVDDMLLMSATGKVFLVTGTHQYVAVTGAKRTVVALEEIDTTAVAREIDKLNAAQGKQP